MSETYLIFKQIFKVVIARTVIFESSDAEQVGGDLSEVVLVRLHDQQLRSLLLVGLLRNGQQNQTLKLAQKH
jgi:hypothetical protein